MESFLQASMCKKVMFFTDLPLEKIPPEALQNPSVDIYAPGFGNELSHAIYHCPVKTSYYNDIIQHKMVENGIRAEKALDFFDGYYYMAYDGDYIIPCSGVEKKKRIYIYDKDFLAHDTWKDVIRELSITWKPTIINFIYPLHCNSITQFIQLRQDYKKINRTSKIILDFFVPPMDFDHYFIKYKLFLLGEITKNSDINIYIGKSYDGRAEDDRFYYWNIKYSLNLLCQYFSRGIPIKAIYGGPPFEKNPYETFYKKILNWANGPLEDVRTIESYFRSKKDQKWLGEFLFTHPQIKPFMELTKAYLLKKEGVWINL